MLLTSINLPIQLINTHDLAFDIKKIQSSYVPYYEQHYAWDDYLLRQNQLAFIQANTSKSITDTHKVTFSEYFLGHHSANILQPFFDDFDDKKMKAFTAIKPTRKRLISEYTIIKNIDGWQIEREKARPFTQCYGKLVDTTKNPIYNISERSFKELPKAMESAELHQLLSSICQRLHDQLANHPKGFNIVVHHTIVYCYPDMQGSNAPEGIHQDGIDFIISAFVIDRKNIQGGKSIIYGKDKKTPIFQGTLMPGQGILQADKDSELWHSVTPIACDSDDNIGYRSTLGFDITLRK
ncbi:MAG: 2OG-Fe dioxygenase family protein [Cellvibrionales bacterium]|nr:2OG-Fe dioxygenase family protein [Cellvibrionales bacterium]